MRTQTAAQALAWSRAPALGLMLALSLSPPLTLSPPPALALADSRAQPRPQAFRTDMRAP